MKDELHDVTSTISHESRELNEAKESGPYVGIFYYVGDKLYWEAIPAADATTSGYVKIYDKKYPAFWEDYVLPLVPQLRKYDAYHFPRGRVVFSPQEGIYRLQADMCILEDRGIIEKIISEMRLPASKVRMSWNIDCECAVCKPKRSRHKEYLDLGIDQLLYTAEDGGRLFFPWKSFWPSSRRGYIVRSSNEYSRIRRGLSLWLKLGLPTTIFAALVIANYTRVTTGSRWLAGVVALATFIPFVVSLFLWLRAKSRGLKEADERY